jgi:glycosyltransferase involved in cell wall biosynthesis
MFGRKSMARLRALYVYAGTPSSEPQWITGHRLTCNSFEWTHAPIPTVSSLGRVWSSLVALDLKGYDLIVSSEYFIGFGINLRLRLLRVKTPHIVWGLNQSRRALDMQATKRFVSWVFNRSTRIVVHSRHEALLFASLHDIAQDKFRFVHWGFDLPQIRPSKYSDTARGPYVCLIGRNNRDVATFCAGLQGTGIRGVVITSRLTDEERDELSRFPHIEVHQDLAMNDCLDCMRSALANVVLVSDNARGAGHITMVAAMLMGKPQIISIAPVVEDYYRNGQTALGVKVGSVEEFRSAVLRLRDDPGLARDLAEPGRQFGLEHCTNDAVARRFMELAAELTAFPASADSHARFI